MLCIYSVLLIKLILQTDELKYTSLEELTRIYIKYGQDIEERSSVRKGFTHRPLGSVESITVLHSFMDICYWSLKAMSTANYRFVISNIPIPLHPIILFSFSFIVTFIISSQYRCQPKYILIIINLLKFIDL